jgi:hypothetical protein
VRVISAAARPPRQELLSSTSALGSNGRSETPSLHTCCHQSRLTRSLTFQQDQQLLPNPRCACIPTVGNLPLGYTIENVVTNLGITNPKKDGEGCCSGGLYIGAGPDLSPNPIDQYSETFRNLWMDD